MNSQVTIADILTKTNDKNTVKFVNTQFDQLTSSINKQKQKQLFKLYNEQLVNKVYNSIENAMSALEDFVNKAKEQLDIQCGDLDIIFATVEVEYKIQEPATTRQTHTVTAHITTFADIQNLFQHTATISGAGIPGLNVLNNSTSNNQTQSKNTNNTNGKIIGVKKPEAQTSSSIFDHKNNKDSTSETAK